MTQAIHGRSSQAGIAEAPFVLLSAEVPARAV